MNEILLRLLRLRHALQAQTDRKKYSFRSLRPRAEGYKACKATQGIYFERYTCCKATQGIYFVRYAYCKATQGIYFVRYAYCKATQGIYFVRYACCKATQGLYFKRNTCCKAIQGLFLVPKTKIVSKYDKAKKKEARRPLRDLMYVYH